MSVNEKFERNGLAYNDDLSFKKYDGTILSKFYGGYDNGISFNNESKSLDLYLKNKHIATIRFSLFEAIIEQAKEMGWIEDKEDPKEPIPVSREEYMETGYSHRCPSCGCYVGTICHDSYIEENEYCCSCGQHLFSDWSESSNNKEVSNEC